MLTGLIAAGAALALAGITGLFLVRLGGLLLLVGYLACLAADGRKRRFDVVRLLYFLSGEFVASVIQRLMSSSV
jgi:hypothetical protein